MLMTIQGEDVGDVEVSDAGAEGLADAQLQAVRVRCRIRPKPSLNSSNNNHNSNTNLADAQLGHLTRCHLIHNSNNNRTSINSRNHLKTLSSSLFSSTSVGLILTLSSEPCLCIMTDMDHQRVNVADVDSRGAVVLDKDNNSVGLHLHSNSNNLLILNKMIKKNRSLFRDVVDAADLAVDKEVSKDVPHNSAEVDAGDREARNAEVEDHNMKM